MDSSKNVLRSVSIAQFYEGKNIFITGATGFMGKVLVEKLLRDCRDVKCIYILVRMKRGVDATERYENYVQDVIFERVRETSPEQLTKIRLIRGDIAQDNLDIDPDDEHELIENLNIIFHCAAKAKFSLTLRQALNFNTCGTLRVLQLAAKIKNLIVFSHVSTSYCCPNEPTFEERYYPACEDPYKVIELLKSPCKSHLDDVEPRLMKGYPNTYALSKILAEDIVHSFRDKFRIIVTRPSIVVSAWQEPFPGWVDSKKSGFTAILLARARGLMRTVFCDPENIIEAIPVDIANNAILVLTCKRALMQGNDVYYSNLTNSGLQKWTLREYFDNEMEVIRKYPLDLLIWWPYCTLTKSQIYFQYRRLLYHYIPAYMGDMACRIKGEKPLLVLHQRKFDTGMHTFGFYNVRHYVTINEEFQSLPNELSEEDKKIFFVDLKSIDMKGWATNMVLGTRKYILKLNDEDSLEFRRGLLTIFYTIDVIARLIFYLILLLVGILLYMFVFNREYLFELIVDIYYSAKYLLSNNLVIPRRAIQTFKALEEGSI